MRLHHPLVDVVSLQAVGVHVLVRRARDGGAVLLGHGRHAGTRRRGRGLLGLGVVAWREREGAAAGAGAGGARSTERGGGARPPAEVGRAGALGGGQRGGREDAGERLGLGDDGRTVRPQGAARGRGGAAAVAGRLRARRHRAHPAHRPARRAGVCRHLEEMENLQVTLGFGPRRGNAFNSMVLLSWKS